MRGAGNDHFAANFRRWAVSIWVNRTRFFAAINHRKDGKWVMFRLRNLIFKLLLVMSLCLLMGADIDCDLEDGEFELDFDGFHFDHHDDDYVEFYYDEWYDPFW